MNLKIDQIGTEEKLDGRIVRFSILQRPEDQDLFALRGRIAAVFEVDTTGSGVDKLSLKKIAEDIFLQHYFSKDFQNNEGVFKESLNKISTHFKDLGLSKVGFAAVAVLDDLIYVARKGNCGIPFFRNSVLEDIKGITADIGKVQAASGKALEGDVLCLTASVLERDDNLQDFLKRLQALDPTKNVALFLYFEKERLPQRPQPKRSWLESKLDIWKQSRSKAIYVRPNGKSKPEGKKAAALKIAAGVLLFGLAASTMYTIYKTRLERRAQLFNKVLGESASRLTEAEEMVGLNNEKARKIIDEVTLELESNIKLAAKAQKEEIDSLLDRLSDLKDRANNVIRVGEGNLYYNLTLRDMGAEGSKLCAVGDGVAVVDKSGKIWFLKREDSEFESYIYKEKSFSTVVDIMCTGSSMFLASSTFVDKLSLDDGEFSLDEGLFEGSEDYRGFSSVQDYLDNLYFLKQQDNQILKYTAGDEGYSDPDNYLKEGEKIAGAVSFAIDGNVYIASQNDVTRFEGGVEVVWDFRGVPEDDKDFSKIYTDSGLDEIFVLNRAVNQVWVINKEGFYVRQFRIEGDSPIDDFAVGSGVLYILSGSKIYETSLSSSL
jgi:hypothetical protein